MRFGDKKTFRVKLSEAPTDPAVATAGDDDKSADAEPAAREAGVSADKLGIMVEPLSETFIREARVPSAVRGVHVSGVSASSGSRGKLVDSDIITEVVYPRPRRAIRTPAELQAALRDLKTGDVITLSVYNVQTQGNRIETVRIGGN